MDPKEKKVKEEELNVEETQNHAEEQPQNEQAEDATPLTHEEELEKELGITLFNRIKGRMQLTEAGQYLYSEIEILVRKEREINFRIDKMKHTFTGTLHIGASTTLSQYVLPETLVRFKNASPQMAISLMSGNTAQIEQEIVTGNLMSLL